MAKPFDAVSKFLVETRPADWVRWLGLHATDVRVVDADLSTVTAESDRVIAVGGPRPCLLHIEFQSGHDPKLPPRLLRYQVLLWEKFEVPVVTVIILLKKAAYRRKISGVLRVETPLADAYVEFGYRVIKVWELSASDLLTGELSLLPLAPITSVALPDVPDVVRSARRRIESELEPGAAREMLTAMGILLGMRYSDRQVIERLLKEVREMQESVTYQMILEEGVEQGIVRGIEQGMEQGQLREARQVLLRVGRKRLGEPDAAVIARLETTADRAELERLIDRSLEVETWADLFSA